MPPFDFLKKGSNTGRYPTDILLGELFVKAGIISQKQLDDTVRNAASKHLHVGQMLTMAGLINQVHLQAAVDAQSLLRDRVIDMNTAARCLKVAVKTGTDFNDLVRQEQAQEAQAASQTNRLGDLLMDSKIINKNQFAQAMQRSMSTGLPLGRILVLNNAIPDQLLRFALELQVRVRDGMMDRQEAIEVLFSEARNLSVAAASDDLQSISSNLKPIKQKAVRIGELLVLANFLGETDVMSCLELGLMSSRPIGEIMVEQGYVSPEMLQIALIVQEMVEDGSFNKEQAAASLRQMHETGRIIPVVQDRIDGVVVGSTPTLDPQYGQQQSPKSSHTKMKVLYDGPELTAGYGGDEGNGGTSAYEQADPGFEEAPSLESLMRSVTGGASFDEPQQSSSVPQAPVPAPSAANSLEQMLEYSENKHHEPEITVSHGQAHGQSADDLDRDSDKKKAIANTIEAARARVPGTFEGLLLRAKVVTAEDIERAFILIRETPEMFVDILKLTGYLTEVGKKAVLDCNNYLKAGDFDEAAAVEVLDHCINQGRMRDLTIDQALEELGWTRAEESEAQAEPEPVEATAAEPEIKVSTKLPEPEPAFTPGDDVPGLSGLLDMLASGDEAKAASAPVAAIPEAPAEAPAPVAAVPEAPAQVPAPVAAIPEAPAEAPAPVAAIPEVVAEVPAPVAAIPEIAEPEKEEELTFEALVAQNPALAEVFAEQPAKPSEDADLLSLFGLGAEPASGSGFAERTPQSADSIIASLSTAPSAESEAAFDEASRANPAAFENTAVFQAVSEDATMPTLEPEDEPDESVESLLAKLAPQESVPASATAVPAVPTVIEENFAVPDSAPGLDSLLGSLGASLVSEPPSSLPVRKSTPAPAPAPAAPTPTATPVAETPVPASAAPAPVAAVSALPLAAPPSSVTAEINLDSFNNFAGTPVAAATGDLNGNGSSQEAKPPEDVDLRSLFSGLSDSGPKPALGESDIARPATESTVSSFEALVLPEPVAVAAVASSATAGQSNDSAIPFTAASPPAVPVPVPQATVGQVAVPVPAQIPVPQAPVTQAPIPAAVPAQSSEPAPAPVQAQAPAPVAAKKPSASATRLPSASSSRLPKMNEEEMNAAKLAQIAAMSSALTQMAEMYYEQENYPESQKAYERILSWRQSELGPSHPDVVDDLNNLAGVMCIQGLFAEAEPLIARAVDILEHFEKPEPLKLAENLTSLAGLQFQQGVFDRAEPLLRKALSLREQELGADSPELADSLRDFAKLLKKLGKLEEAEKHYSRAKVLLGRA